MESLVLDGHVHIYPCFDRAEFLHAALENGREAARGLGMEAGGAVCLLMSETAVDHAFRELRDGRGLPGPWTAEPGGDGCSLRLRRGENETLILVAGRQIATREGLEVLALARDEEYPDGRSLEETLERVEESGAVPVIPWGFGKWWFGRRRLLLALLERRAPGSLFLGDNGGRPALTPRPRIFEWARRKGFLLLPGTDPLPFPEQARTVGGVGFVLRGELDEGRPGESLRGLLSGLREQPPVFGRFESLFRFCRYQVAMQLRKRG